MNWILWKTRGSIGLLALAFWAIHPGGSASGQSVVAQPRPRAYQRVQPRFAPRRPAIRRGYQAAPGLPYNRSPYTDDWSTSRHLPFPKPWMLPTRDPAYRGR